MNVLASFPVDSLQAAQPRDMILSFRNVSKAFPHEGRATAVVDAVDLDVPRGEFVAFLGPSGCGKTTLLNMAAGLLASDNGTTTYDGQTITRANTCVGYLTQADALLPWRTVLGNVTLPLDIRRIPRAERRQRALAILKKVGLAGFERHFPSQLSGGMRKRAALARTLVYSPETLLLDEPFSALDAQTRLVMQQQLRALVADLGLTTVLVTHDLDEAISLADRIVVFSRRPARILADIRVSHQLPARVGDRGISLATPLHERIWDLLSRELHADEAA